MGKGFAQEHTVNSKFNPTSDRTHDLSLAGTLPLSHDTLHIVLDFLPPSVLPRVVVQSQVSLGPIIKCIMNGLNTNDPVYSELLCIDREAYS